MELVNTIIELLKSDLGIGTILTIVVARIGKALSMWSNILELHDKSFVRRKLDKIKNLRKDTSDEDVLATYLDRQLNSEKFRIASGISANPVEMAWLIQLDKTGLWNQKQIKAVARYLTTDQDTKTARLTISKPDQLGARLSIIAGAIMLTLGAFFWISLYIKAGTLGLYAGAPIFVAYTVAAVMFSGGFINYKVARKIEAYLKRNPLPA